MGKYSDWAADKAASMKAVGRTLTDMEAARHAAFFMPWRAGKNYEEGDRFLHCGKLYKVSQRHISAPEWPPDVQSSLYFEILLKDGYRVIPETITAMEAFALGEKGWWKDALYESLIEGNVYTPEQYHYGWKAASA